MHLTRLCAALALTVALLTGCAERSSGPMPAEAGTAIDAVGRVLRFVDGALGSFSGLPEALSTLATNPFYDFGQCPRVTARLQPDGGAAVVFDYDGGCTLVNLAGKAMVGLDLRRLEGMVGFEGFRVFDRGVEGELGIKPFDRHLGQMRVRLRHLRIEDLGAINGEVSLAIRRDGTVLISDGQLSLRDVAGFAGGVDLADLAFNLVRNGNGLPEAGTVKFQVPLRAMGLQSVDLMLKFDADTPKTGRAKAWVGPLGPYSYQLYRTKGG